MTHFKKINNLYIFNGTRLPVVDVVMRMKNDSYDVNTFVEETKLSEEAVVEAIEFLKDNPTVVKEHYDLINNLH